MQLDLPITGGLMVACLVLAGVFGYMGARPADLSKGPRMVPWRFLMLLSVAALVMLLVHLLTIVGFKQDTPQY